MPWRRMAWCMTKSRCTGISGRGMFGIHRRILVRRPVSLGMRRSFGVLRGLLRRCLGILRMNPAVTGENPDALKFSKIFEIEQGVDRHLSLYEEVIPGRSSCA